MSNDHWGSGDELLPGSHACLGCNGLTFRSREDGLCPRCAFEAESLIERIELDGLGRDLALLVEFDAYYRQREEYRKRLRRLASPVFSRRPVLDPAGRERVPFTSEAFREGLRPAS